MVDLRLRFNHRLTMMMVTIIVVGVMMMGRLASYQFQLDTASYLRAAAVNRYIRVDNRQPERGLIYDRNMELLAGNTTEYTIGISPVYVLNKAGTAEKLASVLGESAQYYLDLMTSNEKKPYIQLTRQPVSTEIAQKVSSLDIFGIKIDPEPKRIYPQHTLAAHIIGFVGFDGVQRRGYIGVEGDYNRDLSGQTIVAEESNIPFEANTNDHPLPSRDVVLTIDRNIQYIAEEELKAAIDEYGATSGNVLIMDPRTGEILAMASWPTFDPNTYYETKPDLTRNPIISSVYEPGSVFKIVTAALALKYGNITPDWTYVDTAVYSIGGITVRNWDSGGHGSQTFADILIHSWNVGTTTLADKVMGRDNFYKGLKEFGIGQRTGIDLEGEEAGILAEPGISTYYSDSNLATNSFGQGLSVTPLQMLCFANIIANDGQMMQPHIRLATIDNGKWNRAEAVAVRTPITPEIAHQIRDIMVQVVSIGEGDQAAIAGYTIAGKTGTAEIPLSTGEYDAYYHNNTFIGFLPADSPRVSILFKLDNIPGYASQTAAPAFAKLAERLVTVMKIPTDEQRAQLQAEGGQPNLIR